MMVDNAEVTERKLNCRETTKAKGSLTRGLAGRLVVTNGARSLGNGRNNSELSDCFKWLTNHLCLGLARVVAKVKELSRVLCAI